MKNCYKILFVGFIIIIFHYSIYAQKAFVVFDGYIDGEFEGWDGETLFEMSDGTVWLQAKYSYIYQYAYNPEAIIFEKDGDYFLKVEDVEEILQVMPIEKVIRSKIDGDFEGFEGDTIYKLYNGSVWQQIDGKYKYKYAYSPKVLIYKVERSWKMIVKGITVSVVQLK
jgi:hypothetical protein